jgi:hypothetical protein
MMTFKDFFRLAQYANESWRGCFTDEEIAENAHTYFEEYNDLGCSSDIIRSMIEQLFEDGSDEALEYIAMMTEGDGTRADLIEDKIEETDNIETLAEIIVKCDKLGFYGYGDRAYEKINELRGEADK